jgi:TadE-like protein
MAARSKGVARAMNRRRRRPERARSERGAALVEFALVVPILVLILFAIVEFGWAFFQNLDVRHGAREGARLAAVNYSRTGAVGDDQRAEIIAETCRRMDSSEQVEVGVALIDGSDGNEGVNDVGDSVIVSVRAQLDQLTGFLGFALDDVQLKSTVETRLEQEASFTSTPVEYVPCDGE